MREDITFHSQGIRCAAWLYRPEHTSEIPCIVMAHGFSAVREQRLDAYAQHFAEAGMAVLLFDYRHFGASDGEPRQLLSIRRQLRDWEAAIDKARSLPGIDPLRIALFGVSFSGGHVQAIAERDTDIAAVIAQTPFCDGLRNLPVFGFRHILRLTLAGIRDQSAALLGRPPYIIPAVGDPGTIGVLNTPDAMPGFTAMDPPDSTWRNEVCARIALAMGLYRPGRLAARLPCPIQYIIAEDDLLTPARLAHKAASRAPHAEVRSYRCGHFDPPQTPLWDEVVSEQTQFLNRHLAAR